MSENDNINPVLVTGATGYLAGWIVKNLLAAGEYKIISLIIKMV